MKKSPLCKIGAGLMIGSGIGNLIVVMLGGTPAALLPEAIIGLGLCLLGISEER